jgi:TPR repeat protein
MKFSLSCLAIILLFCNCFLVIGSSPVAVSPNNDQTDEKTLLKFARDYRLVSLFYIFFSKLSFLFLRDGTKTIEKNLARAIHFYQFTIEKSKGGKVLSDAVSELYNLLDDNSLALDDEKANGKVKYSKWDLLILAASFGNPKAQHQLSIALATGIYQDSLVSMDSSRSLFLEYLSALSGYPEASLGMGYRYLYGIGVAQSCEKALPFLEFAANVAVQYIDSKNGFVPQPDRSRLSETMLDNSFRWLKESSNELTDYYAHLAESGEATAANLLGSIYVTGSKNIDPNEDLAIYYLNMAVKLGHHQSIGLLGYLLARKYHRKLIKEANHLDEEETSSTSTSASSSILSSISSIPASTAVKIKANKNFLSASSSSTSSDDEDYSPSKIYNLLQSTMKGGVTVAGGGNMPGPTGPDINAVVGLGYVNLYGIGCPINTTKAMEYFQKALPSHPDAGYYIGEIIMSSQAVKLAGLCFRESFSLLFLPFFFVFLLCRSFQA